LLRQIIAKVDSEASFIALNVGNEAIARFILHISVTNRHCIPARKLSLQVVPKMRAPHALSSS